ncbi:MAG: hypothetical protein FWD38_08735 [Oscillospiraceae bacterium]|nr:hypothetical protein [Oscillospiraceae bacterium]
MKKRIFTLALVVLFALTLIPMFAVADENLIELKTPAGVDDPDSHWGWSSRDGIDTLPKNMRGITGIRIEFDIEPGQAEFVVQSPANWWDHPGATEFDGNTLEVTFADFTDEWDIHNKQYEVHLVFGNWDDNITAANVVNAWLIGEDYGAPQFAPGDENPKLAIPPVGIDAPDSHWGWSMINGSLPWNMEDIYGIIIEFDIEPGQVEFVIQSQNEWWDHPGATEFDGNVLEITFSDFTDKWDEHHKLQNQMHLVFGNWDDSVTPANIVSAELIGTVAEGIPNPESGPVRELGPEGTLPFDMGTGHEIWGDTFAQIGWDSDLRALFENTPLSGPDEKGGLTANLLLQANWMVIYVDNAPDDELVEMVQLTFFGNANGWGWTAGTMEAPTVQIYDTFVPGAIAFPIGGHPYMDDIRNFDNGIDAADFGICFQYGSGEDGIGGIESLGITKVMLYADLPEDEAPAPEPEAPAEQPEAPAPVEPAPEPASSGLPTWALICIIAGGVIVVAVIIIVVVKKKK